jgi:hypothetical protein
MIDNPNDPYYISEEEVLDVILMLHDRYSRVPVYEDNDDKVCNTDDGGRSSVISFMEYKKYNKIKYIGE